MHRTDILCAWSASVMQAAAALERLRQASLERLAGTFPAAEVAAFMGSSMAAMQLSKQHSPQPCMSKAAITGIGGSRRSAGGSPGSGDKRLSTAAVSPPAESRVATAVLLARGSSSGAAAPGSEAPARMSTPVAALLAESARIMSSMDAGEGGGFGSAFGSTGAAAGAAAEADTAATPGGTACPARATVEDDAGFSTPRENAVSLRWLEQQQLQGNAEGLERQAAHAGQVPRYRAATSTAEADAAPARAAAMPAEPLMASHAASMPAQAHANAASFGQVRAGCHAVKVALAPSQSTCYQRP